MRVREGAVQFPWHGSSRHGIWEGGGGRGLDLLRVAARSRPHGVGAAGPWFPLACPPVVVGGLRLA